MLHLLHVLPYETSRSCSLSSRVLRQYVHFGVGCDCCGAYPIRGKRYKCLDCPEEIGFDLCESCHRRGRATFGRFNQKHVAGKARVGTSNLMRCAKNTCQQATSGLSSKHLLECQQIHCNGALNIRCQFPQSIAWRSRGQYSRCCSCSKPLTRNSASARSGSCCTLRLFGAAIDLPRCAFSHLLLAAIHNMY